MSAVGPFFFRRKAAALGDGQAEEAKVVFGNEDCAGLLRLVDIGQVE